MQWWLDAKFGLFIHWGLYALPAGEYKGRKTNNIAEWIMHDFQIPPQEYAQIAEQFDPQQFDAEGVVQLAKKAGKLFPSWENRRAIDPPAHCTNTCEYRRSAGNNRRP